MANMYVKTDDFTKVEEIFRLALDGKEKSLGKDHEHMKLCARGLAFLFLRQERKVDLKKNPGSLPAS